MGYGEFYEKPLFMAFHKKESLLQYSPVTCPIPPALKEYKIVERRFTYG
jgi:hypothetical protein